MVSLKQVGSIRYLLYQEQFYTKVPDDATITNAGHSTEFETHSNYNFI